MKTLLTSKGVYFVVKHNSLIFMYFSIFRKNNRFQQFAQSWSKFFKSKKSKRETLESNQVQEELQSSGFHAGLDYDSFYRTQWRRPRDYMSEISNLSE